MSNESTLIAAALDDRYVIERELGAGGMAVVYLARDRKLDREVALKVLRPELGAVLGSERFLAEIKISARLDHPHILTLIDSGEANGLLYYVLPFVRGESLRDKLNREHQLGIEEALTITKQVASALDYAHRQQLVHRDIKPENILIQEGEAMLADFGIALAVREAGGPRVTESGLSLGTPQYMSPEQATGGRALDARSDVYSLAAVVYEMLAGEPPHTGPTVQAVIAKLLTERPTRLRTVRDTVPEGIDAAVAKALAKVPADRFGGGGVRSGARGIAGRANREWTAPPRGRRGRHRGRARHRGGPLARSARGRTPQGPRLRRARPFPAHVHRERDNSGDLWGRQAGGVCGQALHRRHLLLQNRDSGRGWWREPPCYRRRHGAVQHQVEPRPSLSDLWRDHRVALRGVHRIHAAWAPSVSGDRYGDVLPRRRLPAGGAISKPREHRVGMDHNPGWRSPRQHPDRGCEPPSGAPSGRRPLDGRPVVDGGEPRVAHRGSPRSRARSVSTARGAARPFAPAYCGRRALAAAAEAGLAALGGRSRADRRSQRHLRRPSRHGARHIARGLRHHRRRRRCRVRRRDGPVQRLGGGSDRRVARAVCCAAASAVFYVANVGRRVS